MNIDRMLMNATQKASEQSMEQFHRQQEMLNIRHQQMLQEELEQDIEQLQKAMEEVERKKQQGFLNEDQALKREEDLADKIDDLLDKLKETKKNTK